MSARSCLAVGLVLPFLAVLGPLPWLSSSHLAIAGIPAALAWLFACLPLTSLCMAVAWKMEKSDRQDKDD
ncbi:DUF3311 domain-containing protein [Komagataeibacter medellinensis]|uniref:DUF3311 domain-containing protein n=1 Tax=Komagataeibacter medellinensis (strain NBRC 3288 / BCRC 11682 / LMG 1693 / Kondo 51) TaxID=634177 RepID=G2I6X9_KOMMN|nr:DUF3311 domain-containing protein [Komagataeibacter medellinensis]BAK83876.1 hypothetical protein GLX_14640 [Komagataeibacter medellinensis NBRC 3288]